MPERLRYMATHFLPGNPNDHFLSAHSQAALGTPDTFARRIKRQALARRVPLAPILWAVPEVDCDRPVRKFDVRAAR